MNDHTKQLLHENSQKSFDELWSAIEQIDLKEYTDPDAVHHMENQSPHQQGLQRAHVPLYLRGTRNLPRTIKKTPEYVVQPIHEKLRPVPYIITLKKPNPLSVKQYVMYQKEGRPILGRKLSTNK